MVDANLVNGESIASTDVVLYYRVGVKDLANQGMECKKAGPILEPLGDWSLPPVFADGFEGD